MRILHTSRLAFGKDAFWALPLRGSDIFCRPGVPASCGAGTPRFDFCWRATSLTGPLRRWRRSSCLTISSRRAPQAGSTACGHQRQSRRRWPHGAGSASAARERGGHRHKAGRCLSAGFAFRARTLLFIALLRARPGAAGAGSGRAGVPGGLPCRIRPGAGALCPWRGQCARRTLLCDGRGDLCLGKPYFCRGKLRGQPRMFRGLFLCGPGPSSPGAGGGAKWPLCRFPAQVLF